MKILIVDDNSEVRAVLRQIVEHYGHDVLEAGNGIEGLELAARHKPDAIISDGLMPRMDGYQFLKALKQDEALKLIPFVFHTAVYTGDKEYELAMTLGADALIIKPKAPDDFWKEFTSALEAHASKEKPAAQTRLPERPKIEEEHLRDYCRIVASKLEEKVGELETVIADQKRTKAILQESERRHHMVMENVQELIYMVLVSDSPLMGQVQMLSDSVEKVTGYTRDDFMGNPELWFSIIHPDDIPSVTEITKRMYEEKQPVVRNYRIRNRATGQYRWLEDGVVPLLNEKGEVIFHFGVARDVTEQRRMEDVLKAAIVRAEDEKARSESIIAAIGVGISIQDRDFRILYQNQMQKNLVGDHIGEFCYMEYEKREQQCEGCPVAQVFEDGGIHTTERSAPTDKGIVHVEITASPLLDSAGRIIAGIEVVRNITERKKAEARIKESEERYRNLFDNAHDMIQSIAPDGHFIYVNPSWLKILGYSREDLQSLTIFDIIHSSFKSHCTELIGKATAGEPAVYFDARCIAKDGSLIDVEGSMSVHMVDGKVISIQGILKDVTDRKRLQGQLFKISREWEETFNTITDMVTVHDKDFNIIRANKAAEKILGLPFLEVKKIKCFEYYHGTGCAPEGCPSCQSLLSGKPSTSEIYEPHLKMFIEIRAIPRFDINGNLEGLIHVVRDITERKKNEEALKTYSRELTTLTAASNTLMLITNPENIYQEICDIIYSVFDIKMAWLGVVEEGTFEVKPVAHCGSEDDYLSSIKITWDDSQFSVGPIGMAIKTKKPVMININEPAFAIWKSDAQKRGYETVLAIPILYARDKCLGALTFYSSDPDYFTPDRVKLCQIFSNQAAIAIENARLVSGLEMEVAKRTRALEDTNIELQQLNRELLLRRAEADAASKSKTDFLANMSHELRTPLNAIIGFSEILAEGIAGPIADNQKELVNDISTSGNHLLSLINDILDLSKVEAGKMELEPEEFNLKGLIEGSLVMFKEKAIKHGIKLTTEVEEGIGNIKADERKIKQVLFNLLSNAFKFTPDGGSVRVAARKVKSSESGSKFGVGSWEFGESEYLLRTKNSELNTDLVEISVEDTGIGISSENQQRLFQPFQQIETSLTRKFAGTGLGLSLCRRFVELHGGRIWVESEEGKGSRFVFTIPMKQ